MAGYSSGPIIEELPDDYEEPEPPAKAKASSSSAPPPVRGGTTSAANAPNTAGGGGLRRGFLSGGTKSSPSRPLEATSVTPSAPAARPEVPLATVLAGLSDSVGSGARDGGAAVLEELEEFDVDDQASSEDEAAEDDDGVGPTLELVEGLRRRLATIAPKKVAGDAGDGGAEGRCQTGAEAGADLEKAAAELEGVLKTISGQAKWPTAHVRSSREKAMAEADAALADMRASSNDARRLRSGDEKRAATELRRAAEDALERVRKAAEVAAPKDDAGQMSEEERARKAVEVFHALPLSAKLRMLSDDRAAVLFLGAFFAMGFLLTFGAFAEVYTAWGCGLKCYWAG